MATKARNKLTFQDRLSRLTFRDAAKLLGPDGTKLIQQGGRYEVTDFPNQVYLAGDLFRLKLPPMNGEGDAVVTITTMAERPQRLHWNCTRCETACVHAGAAFSFILDEKMTLGLAAPPRERVPIESLSDDALRRQAISEREERSRTERMSLRSLNTDRPWADYTVASKETGKSYRLAIRGEKPGESYCSCPDFKINTLGTCKHILYALRHIHRRFPPAVRRKSYRREGVSLHLYYGHEVELRIALPDRLTPEVAEVVGSLGGRAIDDVRDLLKRVSELERLGESVTIYPDAEEYIQQRLFLDRMRDLVAEIRSNPKDHPLRTRLLKSELLPYQLDGIAFAAGAGRAILADDMGLGKTIQGIGVAELLAREAGIQRVLVICPASLKSQWRSEIERFLPDTRPAGPALKQKCQLVVGSAESRASQYRSDCFFTVCNYEQVVRDILAIEQVKWDLIIVDEAQRIKNWEAKTTRIVKGLRSRFALALSGTPLENRLDELYTVVSFVDDRRLGPAFRFFNRHRLIDETGKVLGYKNLAELRERLKPILLRRTRQSVMLELPERTTEIRRIAPTDEQIDLHGSYMQVVSNIVRKAYLTEMDLLRLQKALLMCRMAANSTYLVDKQPPGYSTKLEELDDLIDRLFQEEARKVVLFSEWTTMLDLIQPLLTKRRLGYVRLDGSVPQKKRQQLVNEFQNDARCRLFLTTNAGSTGLNLQAANTVINVDLPWNPAVLEQRIARAHRMGQKRPVQVFVLITEETIEERLLATLSAKHELAIAALDVDSEIDQVDLASGMEELKRRLEVLLGAKPEAAVDRSEAIRVDDEAERLARRERVAAAGGELLSAAFRLLGELLPPAAESAATKGVAEELKRRFSECLETDSAGRPVLTLALPHAGAIDQLAETVSRLLAVRG